MDTNPLFILTSANDSKEPTSPPGACDSCMMADVEMRMQMSGFRVNDSDERLRPWLVLLERWWVEFNEAHFDGRLVQPYIELNNPSNPKPIGQYSSITGFGGKSGICIRPSVLHGTHPMVRPGDKFVPGRLLIVQDILLHEMIHQWAHEKLEQPEPKYDGHGPVFARECNRIGEALSLGKVRQSKHKPKKNPEMPSCAQWPHNVRPDDYYLGALADRDGESIRPRLLTVDLDDPCLAGETLGRHLRAEDFPVFLSALIASADTISLEGSA
jgi:hypothetical protein